MTRGRGPIFRFIAQASVESAVDLGLVATRLERVKAQPAPAPPPPPPPMGPSTTLHHLVRPPHIVLDLNTAPDPSTCPSALSGERPSGHREDGGRILGPYPPPSLQGTSHNLPQSSSSCYAHDDAIVSMLCSMPYPKLDFPKFSGENLGFGVTGVKCISRYTWSILR